MNEQQVVVERDSHAGDETTGSVESTASRTSRTVAVGIFSAVVFTAGLLVTESVGEVAVDVDLKPFFLPYLLLGFVRFGMASLSVSVGAALGEGVLDIFEGYELDDPFGFIGYVVGFMTFAWLVHVLADDPTDRRTQAVAAVAGAFVQAVFEGVAFVVFDSGATLTAATVSVLGNTLTHGFLLGALALVAVSPLLADRIDPWCRRA